MSDTRLLSGTPVIVSEDNVRGLTSRHLWHGVAAGFLAGAACATAVGWAVLKFAL